MNSITTRFLILLGGLTFLLCSCTDDIKVKETFLNMAYDFSPEPTLSFVDASDDLILDDLKTKIIHSQDKVSFCIEGIKFTSDMEANAVELLACPLLDCESGSDLVNPDGGIVRPNLNNNISIILHTDGETMDAQKWESVRSSIMELSSTNKGTLKIITTGSTMQSSEANTFSNLMAVQENVEVMMINEEDTELESMIDFSLRSQENEESDNLKDMSSLIIVTTETSTIDIDPYISNYLTTYLLRLVDDNSSLLDYTTSEIDRSLYSESYIATNSEGFDLSLNKFKNAFLSTDRVVFELVGETSLEQTTIRFNFSE